MVVYCSAFSVGGFFLCRDIGGFVIVIGLSREMSVAFYILAQLLSGDLR